MSNDVASARCVSIGRSSLLQWDDAAQEPSERFFFAYRAPKKRPGAPKVSDRHSSCKRGQSSSKVQRRAGTPRARLQSRAHSAVSPLALFIRREPKRLLRDPQLVSHSLSQSVHYSVRWSLVFLQPNFLRYERPEWCRVLHVEIPRPLDCIDVSVAGRGDDEAVALLY